MSGSERDNVFALSVALAPLHAARDAVGLCCQGTGPALEHLAGHQASQVLLPRVASQPLPLRGVLPSQVQDFVLVEINGVPAGPVCLGPFEMSSWSLNLVVLRISFSIVLPSSFKKKKKGGEMLTAEKNTEWGTERIK